MESGIRAAPAGVGAGLYRAAAGHRGEARFCDGPALARDRLGRPSGGGRRQQPNDVASPHIRRKLQPMKNATSASWFCDSLPVRIGQRCQVLAALLRGLPACRRHVTSLASAGPIDPDRGGP